MVGPAIPGTAAAGAVGAGVGVAFYAGFRPFHSSSTASEAAAGSSDDAGPDLSPIAGVEGVGTTSGTPETCTADVLRLIDHYDEYLPCLVGFLIALSLAVIVWVLYPAYVARKGGNMPDVTEETLCPPTPRSSSKFSLCL